MGPKAAPPGKAKPGSPDKAKDTKGKPPDASKPAATKGKQPDAASTSSSTLPKIPTPKSSAKQSTPKGISPSKVATSEKMPTIDARPPFIQHSVDTTPDLPVGATDAGVAIASTSEGPTLGPPSSDEEAKAASAALEAEKAQEKLRAEAEAAELAKRQNGHVVLKYEMYSEQFEIANGSTTAAVVDDAYCLSFVMAGCRIHLSEWDPPTKAAKETQSAIEDVYVREDPTGTYQGLEADKTYYVYVEQEAEQLARDQARMRAIAATMEGAALSKADKKDDGRGFESCSCIEGNPCVDEYGCKDWHNRFAIAMKNGWKGF